MIIYSPTEGHCMLLPHHVFTVLLTENPKVLIENSVSTLVFTKVLTVFSPKIPIICFCGEKVRALCFSLFVVVKPNVS